VKKKQTLEKKKAREQIRKQELTMDSGSGGEYGWFALEGGGKGYRIWTGWGKMTKR